MIERSLLFVMKPESWISAESRYICNVFSSHPWTLIVQRLAVCFDVPVRIERAPVVPTQLNEFCFYPPYGSLSEKNRSSTAVVLHASVQEEK